MKKDLIKYANLCIQNKIISCKNHKLACERFLYDIKRPVDKKFNFYWDEEEARKIVKWFTFLKHSKGELANTPIILTEWQKFFLCQLYGWRENETGYKRFKNFFQLVGRKNAKSQMQAGICLYEVSTQSVKNNESYEIYTAGVKKDQSLLIVNEAKLMLAGSVLNTKFKQKNNFIEYIPTNSFIKALSKEDGKTGDGTNPAVLILDEYHQHKDTSYYALGQGANVKEGLIGIISTAGGNLTTPCYTQEYKMAKALLQKKINNERYFVDIMELDKGDNISKSSIWVKANPIRANNKKGMTDLKNLYKNAKNMPEKMFEFRTKCLNEWVIFAENNYIEYEKWEKCIQKSFPEINGKDVYIGFDLSSKIDLTSISFIIPIKQYKKTKYIIFSHSFIANEENMKRKMESDQEPYNLWAQNKYISLTGSQVIDQNKMLDYMRKFVKKYNLNIKMLCFDPFNATKIMQELSEKGHNVVEVYQSRKSLNEACKSFREAIYCKDIILPNNPVLNFAIKNCVISTDADGLIKLNKAKATSRIDPIVAILCSFKLAMYHEFEENKKERIEKSIEIMDIFSERR